MKHYPNDFFNSIKTLFILILWILSNFVFVLSVEKLMILFLRSKLLTSFIIKLWINSTISPGN